MFKIFFMSFINNLQNAKKKKKASEKFGNLTYDKKGKRNANIEFFPFK